MIDGDTVKVQIHGGEEETVRLLGIDTPESKEPNTPVECGALEATHHLLPISFTAPIDANQDGLLDTRGGEGARVTVTTDPTQDDYDAYGRLLAYVETSSVDLSEAQLSAGWAEVFVFGRPFVNVKTYRRSEAKARQGGRGAWSICGGDFHSDVTITP